MKRGQNTVKRMLDFLWQDWHDGKSDGEVFLYWKDRYEQEFGKYVTYSNNGRTKIKVLPMFKTELTKELLQQRIDHYNAVSRAEELIGRREMAFYYSGKSDAYVNLINELYPELEGERAFPYDEKKQQESIRQIIELHNSARKCQ